MVSSGSDVRFNDKEMQIHGSKIGNANRNFVSVHSARKDAALVKRQKYADSIPREMYKFFTEFSDTAGVPSFEKFAISKGITLEELNSYRSRKKFERAYRECCEIRRDYLIDRALTKRFDPSFVKFLLSECENEDADNTLTLKLEVIED